MGADHADSTVGTEGAENAVNSVAADVTESAAPITHVRSR